MAIHSPNGMQQDRPQLSWVTVRDASGRPHLEARWTVAQVASTSQVQMTAHSAA